MKQFSSLEQEQARGTLDKSEIQMPNRERMTKRETVLRRPLDMRQSVAVEPSFPLISDPLPWGEGRAAAKHVFCAHWTGDSVAGLARRQRRIPPLPRGEGRGEGKENVAHPTVP